MVWIQRDYYEIGKMCMKPEMPKNSESQMIIWCCKVDESNIALRKTVSLYLG